MCSNHNIFSECIRMDEIDTRNGMATLSKLLFFRELEAIMSRPQAEAILQTSLDISSADAHELLYKIAAGGAGIREHGPWKRFLVREGRRLLPK